VRLDWCELVQQETMVGSIIVLLSLEMRWDVIEFSNPGGPELPYRRFDPLPSRRMGEDLQSLSNAPYSATTFYDILPNA
jgi:hypothetical protein